jgi:GTP-binding protein
MFVDDVHNVRLKAGNGGNGFLSFHRERFIPKGGPNGGDGRNGGDVVLIGDEDTNDLSVYGFIPQARAEMVSMPGEVKCMEGMANIVF